MIGDCLDHFWFGGLGPVPPVAYRRERAGTARIPDRCGGLAGGQELMGGDDAAEPLGELVEGHAGQCRSWRRAEPGVRDVCG